MKRKEIEEIDRKDREECKNKQDILIKMEVDGSLLGKDISYYFIYKF